MWSYDKNEKKNYGDIGPIMSDLVKIPTVHGMPELYEIECYKNCLKKQFKSLFEQASLFPIGQALILKLEGGNPNLKPIMFDGHMDVVPADEKEWLHGPFNGEIIDNEVWGRGTQDMKGPQCALLAALNYLCQEGWKPGPDIYLYLSCDEETGGETAKEAAAYFKEHMIQFQVIYDEGGTICENFMGLIDGKAAMVAVGEKGSLVYRFTAKGSGGHGANPRPGTAIARIAAFICDVEDHSLFRKDMTPGVRSMLREMHNICSDEGKKEKLLQASEALEDFTVLYELTEEAGSLLGATIAFTQIHGGTAFNVIPGEAELTANVRVNMVQGKDEVTKILRGKAAQYDIECELVSGIDAARETAADSTIYRNLKHCIETVFPGVPVIPFVLAGGTDSRHFRDVTEETIRFSPLYASLRQSRGVHSVNESVFIEALQEAAAFYQYFLSLYYS